MSVTGNLSPLDAQPIETRLIHQELALLRAGTLRWLIQRTGSPDLAEEIIQQALLRALEKLSELKRPERLQAWFRTIVRNSLIDELRRQQRLLPLEAAGELAAESLEPESPGCSCVLRVLQQVKPAYAELLQSVDLAEKPVKQAAAALGISANHAGVRLHRARQALRRKLYETCGTDSVEACPNCRCAS